MNKKEQRKQELAEIEKRRQLLIKGLAYDVRDAMIANNCIKSGSTELNYMVLHRTYAATRDGKLIWTDEFSEYGVDWETCMDKMLQLKIPLCLRPFNGFYIGEPWDHAGMLALRLNHAFTTLEKITNRMAYLIVDGKYSLDAEKAFQEAFNHGDIDTLKDMYRRLREIQMLSGIPLQPSFDMWLLDNDE